MDVTHAQEDVLRILRHGGTRPYAALRFASK